MARRKVRSRRDYRTIASSLPDASEVFDFEPSPASLSLVSNDAPPVVDERRFSPQRVMRAARQAAHLVNPSGWANRAFALVNPVEPVRALWVCHRRKVRREVLHALGLQKRRGRGGGRARRTWRSTVRC